MRFLHSITVCLAFSTTLFAGLDTDAPNVVAAYLDEQNLVTRGYKDDGLGYIASSPYRELSSKGVMANNLAYYCEGTSTKVSLVKVVLNMNSPKDESNAHTELIAAARLLTKKATGKELPALVQDAITKKQSKTWTQEGYNIAVLTKVWPTGRGYEIKFSITTGTR